ncbi:formyltransferase family protein [Flagellimonas sp. 2504JD1-5]
MKIFFIGTVKFSEEALLTLIDNQAEIVGVATKKKSDFNADFVDLAPICVQNNIPFKHVKSINDEEVLRWIGSLNPDILFCFGWSQLIKKPLLELSPMGVIGYHPAALPKNRGRHPIIWALVLGLNKTASTFFFMKEGADDGDILSQIDVPIAKNDDAQSLYDKLVAVAQNQIAAFIQELTRGDFKRIPQDHSRKNYWRKRDKYDGLIDFRMNSESIYNLVRGLTKPYVGAHIVLDGADIKVWKVNIGTNIEENIEPGKVIGVSGGKIEVKTPNGSVWLIDHEIDQLPELNSYIR